MVAMDFVDLMQERIFSTQCYQTYFSARERNTAGHETTVNPTRLETPTKSCD